MDCPVMDYISNNYYQQKEANDVIRKFVEKMTWKTDEVVLDLGCGPGDVSSNILYPLIKNKIKQLVCADKLHKFIEYAKISYENSHINFKILDIENANECSLYAHTFDKIFSFLCFHWVWNKMNALVNMKSMLRNNGEICIHYLLNNPNLEIYKKMDPEWQIYTKKTMQANMPVYSLEETKTIFEKAGFRVVSIETNKNKFTFQNIASIITFFTTIKAGYTLSSTLLNCSVNVLSNISAATACFIETRCTGSVDASSTSSTSSVPRTESVISSFVRIPETTTSLSISTKSSKVSSAIS
ncbi:juvenile hormone acid O-methyltransferase-like [Sipha flava]|uniref:Juvenile hormone acid O-methyltransferase-like n=1 Tax=Sipha flava TaxID=143950 RepID=A0A8B8FJB8_9HEMI|nr:juvenile hormone acid O-methyltransferase-like [Sipha flava]